MIINRELQENFLMGHLVVLDDQISAMLWRSAGNALWPTKYSQADEMIGGWPVDDKSFTSSSDRTVTKNRPK